MLGWEFPPFLTGGLGAACYGIAKSLSKKADLHLILPKADDEHLPPGFEITALNRLDWKKIRQMYKNPENSFEELEKNKPQKDNPEENRLKEEKSEKSKQQFSEKSTLPPLKLPAQSDAPVEGEPEKNTKTDPQNKAMLMRAEQYLSEKQSIAAKKALETEQLRRNYKAQIEQHTHTSESRSRIRAKIEQDRQTHNYEDFAQVSYVNICLDPYGSHRNCSRTLGTEDEKNIAKPPNSRPIPEDFLGKIRRIYLENLFELDEKSRKALKTLDYFYTGEAKKTEINTEKTAKIKIKEEEKSDNTGKNPDERINEKAAVEPTQTKSTPDAGLDAETQNLGPKESRQANAAAKDWAYKQRLFEDKDNYGAQTMEKVAAYTEVVCRQADHLADFDLIYAHDWMTFPAAMALQKQTRKPLVTHLHALETNRSTSPKVRNEIYDIEKTAMTQADLVVAVSALLRQNITENYAIRPKKIKTVHNGIDPLLSAPFVRQSGKEKSVLFLGRTTKQKGILNFIETADILLKKDSNISFMIAGVGEELRDSMFLAQQKGISDKLRFLGFLSRQGVDKLLKKADVLFMPAVSDPFGLVALEAAQYDVPMVLSAQTGAAELFPHCVQANYWEYEKFAEQIYELLSNTDLVKKLAQKTRKTLKKITWEAAADKLMRAFGQLIPN